jgi:hypothetical protein
MKRQQYNDEELYREIMAELDKGAAEYDRMMASGEAPAKRRKAATMKWYAAAAAVAGLLIVSTIMFVGQQDTTKQTASTEPASEVRHFAEEKSAALHKENADSDIYRLTARMEGQQEQKQEQKPQPASPTPYIYTAMLPEVEFCPEGNDAARSNAVSSSNVRLPQVRKERSFALVCNVVLPDITAYADSTIFASTELMVACDEICYNDSNF